MRLIDADVLIERTETVEYFFDVNWTSKKFQALINRAPTVDAVPVKHGRWNDNYECTSCGAKALFGEKPDPYHPCHLLALFYVCSNYCPNCGAKMDLEEMDDEKR